jgi:hypothetical protein
MYQAQKVSGICVLEVMIYHVPSSESERYLCVKVSGICVLEVMIYHVPSPESERYLCVGGNDHKYRSLSELGTW